MAKTIKKPVKKTSVPKKEVKTKTFDPQSECPECGSNNIVFLQSKNETVCKDCGSVYEELDADTEEAFEEAHR